MPEIIDIAPGVVQFSSVKKEVEKPPVDKPAIEKGEETDEKETTAELPVEKPKPKPKPHNHEEVAATRGWKPFEQWVEDGKAPDEWRDAMEFNIRGDFIGKTRDLEKKLDIERGTVRELAEFSKKRDKFLKAENDRLIDELKAERNMHIKEGNAELADIADKQLAEAREFDVVAPTFTPPPPVVSETLKNWVRDNEWYNANPIATRVAMVVAEDLGKLDPDLLSNVAREGEFLKRVRDGVQANMPHLFTKAKKQPGNLPPQAESNRRRPADASNGGHGLNQEQMNAAKSMGVPYERYAKDLEQYDKER